MEDYIKYFSIYGCDLAMIEPILYDQYYDSIAKINGLNDKDVNKTITERMNDPQDGQIYRELIKDLQVNNRNEVHAFPLFIDYGILYYRKDFIKNPPVSWNDLKSRESFENYPKTSSIYIGQINEYHEFYYNIFENVLNTKDEINYKVVEREVFDTLNIYKNLLDKKILEDTVWHINSEYGVTRFNEKHSIYMRNWSSYLYNVTTTFNDYKKNGENITFGITKTLYNNNSTTAGQSRTINKGVYICVSNFVEDKNISDAIIVAKTFSDKQFMKLLIEDKEEIFYDIPAYLSFIKQDNNNKIDNKAYCERINCTFFQELSEDHVIPTYSIFYKKQFLDKLNEFFVYSREFLSSEDNSKKIETVMEYFKDNFKNAGESTRLTLISINSFTFIANILLIISVCKILL
jgi:hypothetical protein